MVTDGSELRRQVEAYRTSIRAPRFQQRLIQEILLDRTAQIRGKELADIHENSGSYLRTLDWVLSRPELVDANVVADYLVELIRLMENAGAGLDFRGQLDKAINFYERHGQPAVDLYLAKVEYLRLTDTESRDKETTLTAAVESAVTAKDRLKVQLRIVQYCIDTSQYERSLLLCSHCQELIAQDASLNRYLPKLYDLTGITYFYQFDYTSAEDNLLRAVELGQEDDQHTAGEALHYLGRIAIDQGNAAKAMNYFIQGWLRQPDNLADSAWYHLRMGNLLIDAGVIDHAQEHLSQAQELFARIKYDGSAYMQVLLAWGDSYRALRQFDDAETTYQDAMKNAQKTRFYRGELLCYVKMFWLQLVSRKRVDKAIQYFLQAMIHREVWRNLGVRLILSYALQVVSVPLRRTFHRSFNVPGVGAALAAPIRRCHCPMHSVKSVALDEDSMESQDA